MQTLIRLALGVLLAWTLTVDGVQCTTAADLVVACTDPLAITRTITFTIRDDSTSVVRTGTRSFSLGFPGRAVRNSLYHELHRTKYPPLAPPDTHPGTGAVLTLP